jgi:hypothetical protein
MHLRCIKDSDSSGGGLPEVAGPIKSFRGPVVMYQVPSSREKQTEKMDTGHNTDAFSEDSLNYSSPPNAPAVCITSMYLAHRPGLKPGRDEAFALRFGLNRPSRDGDPSFEPERTLENTMQNTRTSTKYQRIGNWTTTHLYTNCGMVLAVVYTSRYITAL